MIHTISIIPERITRYFVNVLVLLTVFSAVACSKTNVVEFCEGVDTEGKGVECGKEFTTGDLTGVVKADQPFETDTLTIKIFREEKSTKKLDKTMPIKVDREKKSAGFDLSFYNGGTYTVEAWKDSGRVGEGTVKITDIY